MALSRKARAASVTSRLYGRCFGLEASLGTKCGRLFSYRWAFSRKYSRYASRYTSARPYALTFGITGAPLCNGFR